MIVEVEYGLKCPYKKDIKASKEECSKCEINNWVGNTFAQCKISYDCDTFYV